MPQLRRATRPAVLLLALLRGTALTTPDAQAATATPEQAQAAGQEVQDWFRSLLAAGWAPPDSVVEVHPEGDAYALRLPLDADAAVTGQLAAQDDGRWTLSGVAFASPTSFTSGPRSVALTAMSQATSGVLDPTYTTASTVQQRIEGLKVATTGGDVQQTYQVARSTSQITLSPAAQGRLDLAQEGMLDELTLDQQGSGPAAHITAGHVRFTGQTIGILQDRGPAFFREMSGLLRAFGAEMQGSAVPGGAGSGDAPSRPSFLVQHRTQLRTVLDEFDGLFSSLQAEAGLDTVQVQAGNLTVVAKTMRLAFGLDTADGPVKAYLDLGTDGLSIPGLPLGPDTDLVPTAIHIRPTLAGVNVGDLIAYDRQVLDKLSDDTGTAPPPDPAPLYAHGGLVIGLDAVSFNLGPTAFAGHGTVTATAPQAYTGEGQVTATDLDALIDRAKQDPLMQQFLAVLTVAKGIGHTSGNQTVWDITYRDGQALVNGVDVMVLAGAAGGTAHGAPAPHAVVPRTQKAPKP